MEPHWKWNGGTPNVMVICRIDLIAHPLRSPVPRSSTSLRVNDHSGLLEGAANCANDIHGANALMMRIYAAMAQSERELISERTRADLAAAKALRDGVGRQHGLPRPPRGPDATAAAQARHLAAGRAANRLALEVERLRSEGVVGQAATARALTGRGVLTPKGHAVWTHTTVQRVRARASR